MLLLVAYGQRDPNAFFLNQHIQNSFSGNTSDSMSLRDVFTWANTSLLSNLFGAYPGKDKPALFINIDCSVSLTKPSFFFKHSFIRWTNVILLRLQKRLSFKMIFCILINKAVIIANILQLFF